MEYPPIYGPLEVYYCQAMSTFANKAPVSKTQGVSIAKVRGKAARVMRARRADSLSQLLRWLIEEEHDRLFAPKSQEVSHESSSAN